MYITQPIRAIVTELIEEDHPLTHNTAKNIPEDLRKMYKTGIYRKDVRARNHKAGLLVDLSLDDNTSLSVQN